MMKPYFYVKARFANDGEGGMGFLDNPEGARSYFEERKKLTGVVEVVLSKNGEPIDQWHR